MLGCVQNVSTNQSRGIISSTNQVLARERRRISGCRLSLLIGSLSTFWDTDGNRKRRFRMLGPYCLPDFLYYSSLMKKRYLAMWIWLCEDKLKVKVAHFRLPSASQKRACLSPIFGEDKWQPEIRLRSLANQVQGQTKKQFFPRFYEFFFYTRYM